MHLKKRMHQLWMQIYDNFFVFILIIARERTFNTILHPNYDGVWEMSLNKLHQEKYEEYYMDISSGRLVITAKNGKNPHTCQVYESPSIQEGYIRIKIQPIQGRFYCLKGHLLKNKKRAMKKDAGIWWIGDEDSAPTDSAQEIRMRRMDAVFTWDVTYLRKISDHDCKKVRKLLEHWQSTFRDTWVPYLTFIFVTVLLFHQC